MSRRGAKRERGVALLALVALISLAATWFLVRQLNDGSGGIEAARKQRTAEVLAEAKRALMGYVAHQAAISGENNPGAFPCPEAPGGYDSITGADGRTQTPSCNPLPAVGRFPWRTIGTDKLVDAYGEPLWYVVASGWSKPSSTGNTVINSNCTDSVSAMTCWSGQLTVDGQANAAVALIIAPGPAMKVGASAGCTAVNQARPVTGNPDRANWLECENATNPADASFVTTGPSGSFNDQVITITAAEILPLVEAAIADRFEREFAPQLKTASAVWSTPAAEVLPYAVPFGNPTTSPTNKFQGASGTAVGMFPGSYAFAESECDCLTTGQGTAPCVCKLNSQGQRSLEPCDTADPRCDRSFVTWRSSASCGASVTPCTTVAAVAASSDITVQAYACTVSGSPALLTCTIDGSANPFDVLFGNTALRVNVSAVASNAAMALRKPMTVGATSRAPQVGGIDTSYQNSPFGYTVTAGALNADGSATVVINGYFSSGSGSVLAVLGALTCNQLLFGFIPVSTCYRYTMTIPMALVQDHPVVAIDDSTYNWFYRNKWHEVSLYAVAPGFLRSGAGSCVTSSTCLQVSNHASDGKIRGLMAIGGRKLGAQVRPATALSDLFEGANADGASPFEVRSATLLPNQGFNDRFAVIDSN
jgi:hypothetical protein